MTVTEYRDRFLQIAHYAPAEVAHDGDKQERFREGLDDHLEYALMNHLFDNFNQLVVTVHIFVMRGKYFVNVKYVFISVTLVCAM
jgi:hypothetical protein